MSITTVRTVAVVEGAPVTFRLPEGDGWAAGRVLYVHVGRARIDCPETAEDYWAGTEDVLTHADYPHTPGYLIDCPACERACHCHDATCVNCRDQAAYGVGC
jgi:hypothetical protein